MKKRYRKKSWIDPRIEIRSSPLHGKGMFAAAPIEKGEVAVICGLPETYRTKEDAEKAAANGEAKGKSIYVGQIGEDLWTVEERGASPAYFINHSCDSNLWLEDEVTWIARRDIKPGEELTIDYALMETDEEFAASWKCVCGSPLCRKRYTGEDWRIPELQERYQNHFTPLISRRIAKLKRAARCCARAQLYIQLEQALFNEANDDFTIKVTKDPEEIKGLLEVGFEYVCCQNDLMFFRKRK